MTTLKGKYFQAGFSLIELMVVISIIALISTIGMLSFRQANMTARDAKRKAALETVRQALVLRKTEGTPYTTVPAASTTAYFSLIAAMTGTYLNGDVMNQYVYDPKTEQIGYTYQSADGSTFTLCTDLETDTAGMGDYCVYSP